jgi:hypothetical protein
MFVFQKDLNKDLIRRLELNCLLEVSAEQNRLSLQQMEFQEVQDLFHLSTKMTSIHMR